MADIISRAGLTVLLLATVPPSAALQAPVNFAGCSPEQTIFFAWAENHVNAVEICKVKNGYRYTYGNIDKPEVRGKVAELQAVKMSGKALPAFVFTHNDISYWLSADKYGEADLMITKGNWLTGTALDAIKLETDTEGYVNRVAQMLPFIDTIPAGK